MVDLQTSRLFCSNYWKKQLKYDPIYELEIILERARLWDHRVHAVGLGEEHRVVSLSTPEGKQREREREVARGSRHTYCTERVAVNRERRMKRLRLKKAGWENRRVKSGWEWLTWILIEGENESGPSRGHQEAIRSSSWVDTCEQALDRWLADDTAQACDDMLSE